MSNYNDVLDQLCDAGLLPSTPLKIGVRCRCKVQDRKENPGWYHLHQIQRPGNDFLLVGAFGIWQGDDNGKQKIKLGKNEALSPEENKAFSRRLAAEKKKDDAHRKKQVDDAARKAQSIWDNASETGDHEYLQNKNVQAHGIRFNSSGEIVIPVRDVNGKIKAVQLISDGNKTKNDEK